MFTLVVFISPRITRLLCSVNFSVVKTNCYHEVEPQNSLSKCECFPRINKSGSYAPHRNGFLTCVMYHVSYTMYHVSDPPLSSSLTVTMSQYIDHTIFIQVTISQINPIFSNWSRCPPTSKYPTLIVCPKWCLYDDSLV